MTPDGVYGVTAGRQLIKFVAGPIRDKDKDAVEARRPGHDPVPLKNKWFFVDYDELTAKQADAIRMRLAELLPKKKRYRTRP